ncbi:hypothetical protein GF354_01885 [Candidatus Peregrinibacteria bacterium]|nr:hypothetical protein [Candidatus Peregrinibacteria bacterium]
MKKALKTIGKIILVDLIVVFIVSTFFVTKAAIIKQSYSTSYDGKGNWMEEHPYVCGIWTENYRCDLGTLVLENTFVIPVYMFMGGFFPSFENKYGMANYIFIIFLTGYFFRKEYKK